jgi:hypothetical protein
VVATMPMAGQQAIRTMVRDLSQERNQWSAGADRLESVTGNGWPPTAGLMMVFSNRRSITLNVSDCFDPASTSQWDGWSDNGND